MAWFPCDYGPHPNPRANHLFYVGISSPTGTSRWKRRFCAEHTAIVQEDLAEFKVGSEYLTSGLSNAAKTKCLSCGEPIRELAWQVFVTGYPAKDEREDYWSQLHTNCALPEHLAQNGYDTPQAS